MLVRTLSIISLMVLLSFQLAGQDRPAPEYLTKQELPDSVRNTTLVSLAGNETILSNVLDKYKGKTVLIDFWASWCRDCLVSLPEYNKLRKKTRNDAVVYLLLSVDKDERKWKLAISRLSIEGEHYRFTEGWKNPFSNYVDLDWIPRYLVLDQDGKIIAPKFIHIDDKTLFKTLVQTTEKP